MEYLFHRHNFVDRINKKICDTFSFVDTSNFGNPTHLIFHCVFSFVIRFCDGSSTYISYIVLIKYWCSLCSFSQLATNFFLIGFLSLNTCFLVTLLLVMAIFTSTIWTKGFKTLGLITTCFFVGFTYLFLNTFYISLYLRQSIISYVQCHHKYDRNTSQASIL